MCVLRSVCSCVTITAAGGAADDAADIAHHVVAHERADLVGVLQQADGLLARPFPCGRPWSGTGLRVGRRHGHADHVEHDAQADEHGQHQRRHGIPRPLQSGAREEAQQAPTAPRPCKNTRSGPAPAAVSFSRRFCPCSCRDRSRADPSALSDYSTLNRAAPEGKSYGLGTGWISPQRTSRRRSGGFPFRRCAMVLPCHGTRLPLSPHCNPSGVPVKRDSLGDFHSSPTVS